MNDTILIPIDRIEHAKYFYVPRETVILDHGLAALYGVCTKFHHTRLSPLT